MEYLTQEEYCERLYLMSKSCKELLQGTVLFMQTLLTIFVEKGVFTMEEFENAQSRVQPQLDQALEKEYDEMAKDGELLAEIVHSFKNLQ